MQSVEWKWREGSRHVIEAEVAALSLEELKRKLHRHPEPADIVAAAADRKSPLHAEIFNCDDDEAAQKFREHRARTMLNSLVRIVVDVKQNKAIETIAFVNVRYSHKQPDGSSIRHSTYMPMSEAVDVPDYYEFVIQDALRYAAGFKRRVAQLKEFKEVCEAIERAQAEFEEKKKAKKAAQKQMALVATN